MNKYNKRFNIGFSLYQGIAGLVFTSIGLYSLCKWIYKVLTHKTEFPWSIFLGISLTWAFSATIIFIIIKLGLEQLKK